MTLMLLAAGKVILADSMDPDAFWHLRVADQLAHEGVGPLVDQISFASDKTPWTPYSWLAELFMRAVWMSAGFPGAVIVTALSSAAIVGLIALACREAARLEGIEGYFRVALLTAIGAFFCLAYLSFRPVTFALVLLALSQWIIWRDRRTNSTSRAIWLVPVLALLMTNMHLYVVFVVILMLLRASCDFIQDRPHFRRSTRLAILTLVASLGTPLLPGVLTTALNYNSSDPMVAANYIAEMRPFYTGPMGGVNVSLVLMLVGFTIAYRKRLSPMDAMVLIVACIALVRLGRFLPVFSILAMPVFARTFPKLSDRVLARPPLRWAMTLIVVLGLVNLSRECIALRKITFDDWLNRNIPGLYPVAAARVLDGAAPGQVINEFSWGGYLAWRLPASSQVFMDGRTQLYKPDFWNRAFFNGDTACKDLLANQSARIAILPVRNSRFERPLAELGWTVSYKDDAAIIMIAPSITRTE